MNLLIGTKNRYKIDEILSYLENVENLEIHFLEDQKIDIDVEEDGNTLEENARKKAREISKRTSFFVLASDGGVDIPALGEEWDFLKNQRTVGKEKSDIEKAQVLLDMANNLTGEERKVIYHHALAIAKKGKVLWSNQKVAERGYLAHELPDKNIPEHKWLSHIWYYPEFGKVFNKLNPFELKKAREQSKELKESLQKFLRTI